MTSQDSSMRGLQNVVTLCYLYEYGAAREIVCACYGGLPAMVTVAFLRCAGAIRERRMTPNQKNLDSGPQVSFNLLCVDGLGCLWWCGACWCSFCVSIGYSCYCLPQVKTETR